MERGDSVRYNSEEFKDCLNCTAETGRHVGCHGTCIEYLEAKMKHEEILRKRKVEKERFNVFRDYLCSEQRQKRFG